MWVSLSAGNICVGMGVKTGDYSFKRRLLGRTKRESPACKRISNTPRYSDHIHDSHCVSKPASDHLTQYYSNFHNDSGND